jgi:hypothetical protein
VNDLYNEKYETSKDKLKKKLKIERPPCSWIGRIHVAKMVIITRVVYRVNEMSVKIPMSLFREVERSILIFDGV